MATKVLVVEDNVDTVTTMKLVLQRSGYEVQAAFDGEQGLARAKEWRPDVILLDMMMPVMDGFTMNQYLKKDPELARIPVIVLTARLGMSPLFDSSPESRVDGYLVKPVTGQQLTQAIESAIASARK